MLVGRVIGGKYRLIEKIDDTAHGTTWCAEDITRHTRVNVNLLQADVAGEPEALSRFKREVQSATTLRSTNIARIFGYGVDSGEPYVATELLDDNSLAKRLATRRTLSAEETAHILTETARALTWSHDMGIIHGGLNPGSIFPCESDNGTSIKLADFGIAGAMALVLQHAPDSTTRAIQGIPSYLSPEQVSGQRGVDYRTDIWSLGVVAFECVTGSRAFAANTFGALQQAIGAGPMPIPSRFAAVPSGFDEWFARCAHRDPRRRFLSIAEAADVLQFVCGLELEGSPTVPQLYSEPPPGPTTRTVSQSRQRATLDSNRTTDAPSTLSLVSGIPTLKRHYGTYVWAGVIITGLLGAAATRYRGARDHASQASLAPTAVTANDTLRSPPVTRPLAHSASAPQQTGAVTAPASATPTPAMAGSTAPALPMVSASIRAASRTPARAYSSTAAAPPASPASDSPGAVLSHRE